MTLNQIVSCLGQSDWANFETWVHNTKIYKYTYSPSNAFVSISLTKIDHKLTVKQVEKLPIDMIDGSSK